MTPQRASGSDDKVHTRVRGDTGKIVSKLKWSVDYDLQSFRDRLCVLQYFLDLVKAFVLLPEVICVLALGEVRGLHRVALEGLQANVLDLPFDLLALNLFLASSPEHPLDDRPHNPPHKEELVTGQKGDEGSPLQNRLSGWDLAVVTRVEHVDECRVHEGGDPREARDTFEPWSDGVRSDGDGPAKVSGDFKCVGAELDVVVDQCHDFEECMVSENRLGAT